VIGGRAGGIPEVIEDGVTGYLVAPGAAEELARRIGELCRDSELRRLMGQAARHRVETQFSREMMVHRTAAFYQKVIGRSSQG
jgi:glycosyltransferase involved in cell wall biosynthesis